MNKAELKELREIKESLLEDKFLTSKKMKKLFKLEEKLIYLNLTQNTFIKILLFSKAENQKYTVESKFRNLIELIAKASDILTVTNYILTSEDKYLNLSCSSISAGDKSNIELLALPRIKRKLLEDVDENNIFYILLNVVMLRLSYDSVLKELEKNKDIICGSYKDYLSLSSLLIIIVEELNKVCEFLLEIESNYNLLLDV